MFKWDQTNHYQNNNKEMMKFNIEWSKANLTKLLEPVNLKTYKGVFAFISASNWLKLIEEPIANVEKNLEGAFNLHDHLTYLNGRYYPDSKRAKNFLVLYFKCKKCDNLNYSVTLNLKPELNEAPCTSTRITGLYCL